MKKFELKEFIGVSLLAAIIIVMATVPQLGFIQLPFLAITITLIGIPVLLGATLYGKKGGLILGLVFGLSSLAVALFRPTTPLDLLFRNPVVSVLPRLIFPLIYVYLLELDKKVKPNILGVILTILVALFAIISVYLHAPKVIIVATLFFAIISLIGTAILFVVDSKETLYIFPSMIAMLSHSVIVLTIVGLLYGDQISELLNGTVSYIIIFIISTNSLFEAIFTTIILQLIAPTIVRYYENE